MASFRRLDINTQEKNILLPQAADNQWIPQSKVSELLKKPSYRKSIVKLSRGEIVHSLLEGETVVINRAFIFNNPAISEWYTNEKYHSGLVSLLESNALAILWMFEESPEDAQLFSISNPDEVQYAWSKICAKTDIPSVKLTWENNRSVLLNNLAFPLPRRLGSLTHGDIYSLCQMLGLYNDPNFVATQFGDQLKKVMEFSDSYRDRNGFPVTREALYGTFVCQDGSRPSDLRLDNEKPFFFEIKSLVDLIYNTNAANALRINSSTPADSLNRSALMELHSSTNSPPEFDPKEVARIVYNVILDEIRSSMSLPNLASLPPEHIHLFRQHDTFANYQYHLKSLRNGISSDLNLGRDFLKDIQMVKHARRELALRLSEYKIERHVEMFEDSLSLLFEIGALTVEIPIPSTGNMVNVKIDGGNLIKKLVGQPMKMVLKFLNGKVKNFNYASSVEIGSFYLKDAGVQIEEFLNEFEKRNVAIESDETELITESAMSKSIDNFYC